MASTRPSLPGIERSFGWVPTYDTSNKRALDPSSLFNAGRHWTPFGLIALGHTLTVNVATGGLSVTVRDLSIPYQSLPLEVVRTLDVQEQHTQYTYLDSHPNTDPRFHFFGNWQFQQEVQISSVWHHTYPELLVNAGNGASNLFYREYPDFDINTVDVNAVGAHLHAYGVPGRTLTAVSWQYAPYDYILRTRQGAFNVLAGHYFEETLVDPVELRLWHFMLLTGYAQKYTSEYSYQNYIDVDGLREVNPASLISLQVDALGHTLAFQPAKSIPPYRTYVLTDGSNRTFQLELEHSVTYLDGNYPGGYVKTYLVSRVIDQTRATNNVLQYIYDHDRLIEVQYPGQTGGPPRSVKYSYDASSHLIGLTDSIGNTYSIEYLEDMLDADDRLVPRLKVARIADSEGNSAAYHYDHPNSRVVVVFTDAQLNSRTIVYTYLSDVNDTQQRFITSEVIEVVSGYSGNQTVQNQWAYSQDGHFQITSSTDPLGNTSAYEYNGFNQTTATIDPTGHRREFEFDVQVLPTVAQPHRYDLLRISETNVDLNGNTFLVERKSQFRHYDTITSGDANDSAQSTHRIASQTDERGNVWKYDYDEQANHLPLKPTQITDPAGFQTHWTFDASGSVLQEIDAEGNTRTWAYNLQGQLLSSTDENGFHRYWVYDAGTGWLTDATDALGTAAGDPAHSTHYEWNDSGQRTHETDAVGAITDYSYYQNRRLKSVTRYDPTPRPITFAYDASGNLISISDANGHTTIFHYDEAGRLYESYRDNSSNPTIKFVLDPAGHVILLIDRNGQTTQYAYNPLGRVTDIQEPNWPLAHPINLGKSLTFQYDRLGQRLRMTDSELPNSYTYSYDPSGNLTSKTDPFSYTLQYDHDSRDNLIRLYDDSATVDLRFDRDNLGRVSAVTDSSYLDPSQTFRFTYTDGTRVNNLYRIDVGTSSIETRFQYDPNQRLTSSLHQYAGAMVAHYGYGYRADGLVGQTTGTHKSHYDYDGMKQLVTETDVGMHAAYDGAGNRLWRAAHPLTGSQQNIYDANNGLLRIPSNGTTFTYDKNGNVLTRQLQGGKQVLYTYDGANRLARVKDGSLIVDYLYDGDGHLLQRSLNDASGTQVRRYRYANKSILTELDEQGKIHALYTRDDHGRLLRRRGRKLTPTPTSNPHSLFYLLDGLRNVCRLLDSDGAIHLHVAYDAWGRATSGGTVNVEDLFRYREGYQDPDTGLLNFGTRWYDPDIGRWLSQDPLFIDQASLNADLLPNYQEFLNLYTYVKNNPLAYYDPEGLNATLPPGWPEPPGWNNGQGWENVGKGGGKGRLRSPDGKEDWHWDPETHPDKEHWDIEDRRRGGQRGKRRVDEEGKDIAEDEFKRTVLVTVLILAGWGVYEGLKWGVAVAAAPETAGASLAAAAALP